MMWRRLKHWDCFSCSRTHSESGEQEFRVALHSPQERTSALLETSTLRVPQPLSQGEEMGQRMMSVISYTGRGLGYLLSTYPAIPFLQAYIRGAVQVTLTLNPVGCWICDLLEIIQQSLMKASLTAFTSSIKTAASAFFLPYQFCHIFVSSFWALHQLHLLPASPSSPISCHCKKKDADFHTVTASQETNNKW